ncbi:hypothetical protein ACQ859_16365 [Roseateles chitinivorans]|uniref:hypothetical protein n=1 Tax=Roseateles chitinivorans TaxID=2917965 RepID=UPI003D67909F
MSTIPSQAVGMGGAVPAAVEAVVTAGTAVAVADAGSKEAFLDSWTRILVEHARHLRAKGEELPSPFVICYASDWSDRGSAMGWTRRRMLGSRVADPLAGQFAIGRLEAGAFVCPEPIASSNDAEAAIDKAGLNNQLTLALMSATELWIWPHGLDAETNPSRRTLDDAKVVMDLSRIDQSLNIFYEEVARQTRKWWVDSTQRIVVPSPESVVQEALWHFLLGCFADRANIRQEDVSGNGRMDIVVRPRNSVDASAVMELKTTRDFATPKAGTTKPTPRKLKENLDWAVSGVAQAAGYRDKEQLTAAFLCVYDFCAGELKELEDEITKAAAPYEVIARRYWITNSNEEHRKNRYPHGGAPPPSSGAPPPAAAPP